MTTRVYHPTSIAFYDVADDTVDDWKETGWTEKPGKHLEDHLKGFPPKPVNPPADVAVDTADDDSTSDVPGGNASLEDWKGYARTQGASEADLEGATRNDLRAAYGPQE